MSAPDETIFSINGNIVPAERAVIPVTDRGLLYGDGVFETIHAYGRTLFRAADHLRRLADGTCALFFDPQPDSAQLLAWLQDAVDAANFPEANVRLTVTRGSSQRGPSITGAQKHTAIITVTRFQRRLEKVMAEGVGAVVSSIRRQEAAATARLKTLNYLEQILARREADAAGVDEALLLNTSGVLCEGSASNISLIRHGVLTFPDPKLCGALPGIAQLTAIEAAENLKIPVAAACLSPWDLTRSDEAFLTGSMREITPLVSVGGQPAGSGKTGPLTLKIIGEFRKIIEKECAPFKF